MNKRRSTTGLIFWSLAIMVSLWVIWTQWVGLNYDHCTIDHRSDNHLTTPRDIVRAECRKRLNPFY